MADILCYGAICADLRMWLPQLPRPGAGVHVERAVWMAGGNALNEARALAGWGAPPLLLGDLLGADAAGDLLAAELDRLGLAGPIVRDPAATTPICHILITPDGERTILALRAGTAATPPAEAQIAASRIVSVARYGHATAQVALAARRLGRLVVAGDAWDPAEDLAAAADVIVTSAALLGPAPAERMAALHARRGAAVVVTDGPRPVRALVAGAALMATPPALSSADTTGAGDTFRAGVVYGLWRGWGWPQILAFAAEAAAAGLPPPPAVEPGRGGARPGLG